MARPWTQALRAAATTLRFAWPATAATLLFTRPAAAAPKMSLNYGLELGLQQIKDELLRPLAWAGPSAALTGSFGLDFGSSIHRADLWLGSSVVYNRFDHVGVVVRYGTHWASLYEVATTHWAKLYLGPAYRFDTLTAYYADWDDSFMYWYVSHSLAPALAFVRQHDERSSSSLQIEMPLIGVLSRAPTQRLYKTDPLTYPSRWLGHTHQDLSVSHPGNLFAPTLTLNHTRLLGECWGLSFGYEARYRHTSVSAGFASLTHAVKVEVHHDF